ncbi:DUF4845 domain-containing protein [Pseudomonas sp. F1_0610]|uniref:DUF4845 domain-containing protein n=1 Tax=Pseudomonas sp. F1_0610 TaxID=3114284 RepID=UPI0039C1D1C3
MKTIKQQKGATLWGTLFVLAVVGFFAMVTVKLVPFYMDNLSIEKIIKGAEKISKEGSPIDTVDAFYTYVEKSLPLNNIRDLKVDDIMKVEQVGGEFVVKLDYERKTPLVKNIGVVMTFNQEYRVRVQ